jgi:hypothetical protein
MVSTIPMLVDVEVVPEIGVIDDAAVDVSRHDELFSFIVFACKSGDDVYVIPKGLSTEAPFPSSAGKQVIGNVDESIPETL